MTVGQAAMTAGKIKYAFVFRGVKGNPIVTSWYPIFLSFGGEFFDDKWKVTFNSAQGKAAADFFVGTLKSLAPKGVAEFDSDQEGAAILGGEAGAIIQYTGNAIKSDDPTQSKEVGKLDFARRAEAGEGDRADRHLHPRRLDVGAEQGQRDHVHEVVRDRRRRRPRSRAPATCRCASSRSRTRRRSRRTACCRRCSRSSTPGAEARPRTPDWAQVESILGTELNKALVAGKGGGAALDRAAKQATAYLKRQGYYS